MSKLPPYRPAVGPPVPQEQYAAYRAASHAIEDQLITQIVAWRGRVWQGIVFPAEISVRLAGTDEITKGYYLLPGQMHTDPPYVLVRYVPQAVFSLRDAWGDKRNRNFDGRMDFALAALYAWLTEAGWTVIPHMKERRADSYSPELQVNQKVGDA